MINIASGESRQIASSPFQSFDAPQLSWSPDSRWLAYVNSVANMNDVIFLYGTEKNKSTPVTSERVISDEPFFSPDGKWLYFLSGRSFHSVVDSPWGPYQPEPFFDKPIKIYQIGLGLEERSPFQANNELSPKEAEEGVWDSPKATGTAPVKANTDKPVTAEPPIKAVAVNLEGISNRLWEVPVPSGRYEGLHVTDKALYLLDDSLSDAKGEIHRRLVAIEIKTKDAEIVALRPDVKTFRLSRDGKKFLIRENDDFYVTDAGTEAIANLDKNKVNLDALKFSYFPKDDWRQMYADAWRMHRDCFYDKSMHGVDWKGAYTKYLLWLCG